MQSITIAQITETGTEDALAVIEELEATGRLSATDDSPLSIIDDYGAPLTTRQAIAAIRERISPMQSITYTVTHDRITPEAFTVSAGDLRAYLAEMNICNGWELDLDTLEIDDDGAWIALDNGREQIATVAP